MRASHFVCDVSGQHIEWMKFLMTRSDRDGRFVDTECNKHEHCTMSRGVLSDFILERTLAKISGAHS